MAAPARLGGWRCHRQPVGHVLAQAEAHVRARQLTPSQRARQTYQCWLGSRAHVLTWALLCCVMGWWWCAD